MIQQLFELIALRLRHTFRVYGKKKYVKRKNGVGKRGS